MKKKTLVVIVSILVALLVFSNFWGGFRLFINYFFIHNMDVYEYSSLHGEFKIEEDLEKGGSLKEIEDNFKHYKKENPNLTDTTLYRTFKKNPLHFWDWSNYLFSKRFRYPYLTDSEVHKKNS